MEVRWLILLLSTALLARVDSQGGTDPISRLCSAATRCRDCILASPQCAWCADVNFNGTSRCYRRGQDTLCSPENTQNPTGGAQDAVEESFEGLNQISPSRISVNVRPGDPIMFPLSVEPANNFPIDLYLLMDLSFSMRDDLDNLKALGAQLAARIVGISTNFAIGFGSFVDKRLAPFVNVNPARLENPCVGNPDFPNGCQAPYSFRHVISLTPNQTLFNERVQAQVISGNQDSPEGGFDGFLQSIVCTQLIGWRQVSRKLLLFITDAGFHFAGDGKLGGVIVPHDGLCKMPNSAPPGESVDYEEWDTLDYPSVGQIAEKLREFDIIPIFAAEQSVKPFYDALAEELGEGAFTGTLAADSSNVVDLVETLYNEISQRIVFDPEPIPGVTFEITPTSCPGQIAQDGTCTGVRIGQRANFQASVTLQECTPELSARSRNVTLRVVGFGSITVELTAICRCPCEDNEATESAVCNGNGTLSCGICVCNTGYFGEFCQCDQTGQTDGGQMLNCPLGENGQQCTSTDRGTCTCGECLCRRDSNGVPLFYGPACECDDSQCGRGIGNAICSNRGTCTCEGCQCEIEPTTRRPYISASDNACECFPEEICLDPTNRTEPCNGQGMCSCEGMCQCNPSYTGRYCETFIPPPTSANFTQAIQNCNDGRDCAECALDIISQFEESTEEFFMINPMEDSRLPEGTQLVTDLHENTIGFQLPAGFCRSRNCSHTVVIINGTNDRAGYDITTPAPVNSAGTSQYCESDTCAYPAQPCTPLSRDRCTYEYFGVAASVDVLVVRVQDSVVVTERNIPPIIHVEYERTCTPPPFPAWAIALLIIIPLLILGLLALLLLKVLLLILDAIEVRRFEEEVARTKHSKLENPLYRSAQKEYKNPIYGK